MGNGAVVCVARTAQPMRAVMPRRSDRQHPSSARVGSLTVGTEQAGGLVEGPAPVGCGEGDGARRGVSVLCGVQAVEHGRLQRLQVLVHGAKLPTWG